MIYIYGMDLAETLNYFACTVTSVEGSEIKLKTIIKKRNVLYPELEELVVEKLIPKFPPSCIVTDYTSEKAFSEFLERRLHPSFANPHSSQYKKWKMVVPVVMNDTVKLNMKQNARQMLQDGFFKWPKLETVHPALAKRVIELKEQLFRESAAPSKGAVPLKFPKPVGENNDIAISFELNLLKAREYLGAMSGTGGVPMVIGRRVQPSPVGKEAPFLAFAKKNLKDLNVTKTEFKWD